MVPEERHQPVLTTATGLPSDASAAQPESCKTHQLEREYSDYREQYLAVLPELRSLSKSSMSRLRKQMTLLLPLGLLAGLALALQISHDGSLPTSHSAAWLLVANLAGPALIYILGVVSFRLGLKLRLTSQQEDWLEASGLADRIEFGELYADPLLEQLSATERRRMEERDTTPLRQLLRVCRNYIWYLTGSKSSLWTAGQTAVLLLLGPVLLITFIALWPTGWAWVLGAGVFNTLCVLAMLFNQPGELGEKLADYLEAEWRESAPAAHLQDAQSTEGAAVQADVPAAREPSYDRARIAHTKLIINEIELSSMPRNIQRSGAVDTLIVLPPLLALSSVSIHGWPALIYAAALAVASLKVWLLKRDRLVQEQRLVDQRLQRSAIALEIASGSLSGSEPLEHAPTLLRPVLSFFVRRQSKRGGLRDIIPLISDNLDWYLGKRGPLWRWHWLAWLAVPAGLLIAAVMVLMQAGQTNSHGVAAPTWHVWLMSFLLLAPLLHWWLSHAWLSERQAIWNKALTTYLRRHAAGE
ncbi:hypothetical protein IT575_05445 [bacterium]|nr:hypothetical protein [bacterium]